MTAQIFAARYCPLRRTTLFTTNITSRRRFVVRALSSAAFAASPFRSIANAQAQKIKGSEMTTLTPYLLFEGKCYEAMEFYKTCFDGELTVLKVKDSPAKDHMPEMQQNKVLNARLRKGNLEISASDWLRLDRTPVRGNMVCLYLSGGTTQELNALFQKLSEGAEVTDPLQEFFQGYYGALNDKFSVRWMFHG
jgi:PhnB protein